MIRMDQAKKEKLRDFFNQFFDDADNDDEIEESIIRIDYMKLYEIEESI